MENNGASRALALLTSNLKLVDAFLSDRDRQERAGVEIPLVIGVRPSMRFMDRLRDVRRTIIRRSRINHISPWEQVFHHFVFRYVSHAARPDTAEMDNASVEKMVRRNHEVRIVRTVNASETIEALSGQHFDLGIVVGADMFSRRTLRQIPMPLYNVHLSDPQFVRGMPPVFWEIFEGREEIKLTLQKLVPRLDAGPVIHQRIIHIEWGATLVDTMRRTRRKMAPEIAALLFHSLPGILDGTATVRNIAAGPLRTNPTTSQIIHAHRICRNRCRENGNCKPGRRGQQT